MIKEKRDDQEVQVVFAIYGGDSESRRNLSGGIIKYCKEKAIKVDLALPLHTLARSLFNVPPQYLLEKDKEFLSPILVNDFTIKRAIKTIYDSLGTLANFNPNRIGLNNFNRPRLKSGNDVLKFIGFELIRKVYPNFLSVVSCKNILGRTGNFVVEGIKFYDEYNYLVDNFQLVYPIKIEEKKAKKDDVVDDYAVLKDDLRDIQPSSVLSFGLSAKDGLKEAEKLCPKIEENVNELLELGDVKPIFIPQVVAPNALNHNQSNESGVIRTNNAVFEKKAHIWSDDEVIV